MNALAVPPTTDVRTSVVVVPPITVVSTATTLVTPPSVVTPVTVVSTPDSVTGTAMMTSAPLLLPLPLFSDGPWPWRCCEGPLRLLLLPGPLKWLNQSPSTPGRRRRPPADQVRCLSQAVRLLLST